MAGKRRWAGKPLRAQNRNGTWQQRIADAKTAEQTIETAYDWLRSSCRRYPDKDESERVLAGIAQQLATEADRLDRALIAAARPQHRADVYRH